MREAVGLPITVGVATTKSLAKVASALAKPDGLMVVPPECELALLHGLRVERLSGVGPVTEPGSGTKRICAPPADATARPVGTVSVVLPAAGAGARFAATTPKPAGAVVEPWTPLAMVASP